MECPRVNTWSSFCFPSQKSHSVSWFKSHFDANCSHTSLSKTSNWHIKLPILHPRLDISEPSPTFPKWKRFPFQFKAILSSHCQLLFFFGLLCPIIQDILTALPSKGCPYRAFYHPRCLSHSHPSPVIERPANWPPCLCPSLMYNKEARWSFENLNHKMLSSIPNPQWLPNSLKGKSWHLWLKPHWPSDPTFSNSTSHFPPSMLIALKYSNSHPRPLVKLEPLPETLPPASQVPTGLTRTPVTSLH